MYIIKAIKYPSANVDEITDETQRLCDVQPYFGLFRIAERQEVSEDSKLNENITSLIGKTLSEFKTLKNPEVRRNKSLTKNFHEILVIGQSFHHMIHQTHFTKKTTD